MKTIKHKTEAPQIAVAQIGAALWAVRRSGHSIGYYHHRGDANRVAKSLVKATPGHALRIAEAC